MSNTNAVCNYCCNKTPLKAIFKKTDYVDKIQAYILNEDKQLQLDIFKETLQLAKVKFKIKYCPVCGRKLKN